MNDNISGDGLRHIDFALSWPSMVYMKHKVLGRSASPAELASLRREAEIIWERTARSELALDEVAKLIGYESHLQHRAPAT
jgi:hypothetical protein